ncbi:MAG TPA: sigma-70 family RNA polymerase sigma factor, partial [Thermoanaerobaculia bacterium]|nr:sigma-70 family RNA polymerase sigma factor [Thermoanaerobaculia bacterium]
VPVEESEDVLTDEELLKRTAAGEREAFDDLVVRHQAAVFRFARAATAGPAAAEDVLQETFLAAWRAAGTFRGRSAVRTWLLTIARNQAWHQREREARLPMDDVPLPELGEAAGWGDRNPEEGVLRSERRECLARALEALGPEEREILVLRELEELTGEETAAALGIGLAAMKSRLHRARLRLAAELRRNGPC